MSGFSLSFNTVSLFSILSLTSAGKEGNTRTENTSVSIVSKLQAHNDSASQAIFQLLYFEIFMQGCVDKCEYNS